MRYRNGVAGMITWVLLAGGGVRTEDFGTAWHFPGQGQIRLPRAETLKAKAERSGHEAVLRKTEADRGRHPAKSLRRTEGQAPQQTEADRGGHEADPNKT